MAANGNRTYTALESAGTCRNIAGDTIRELQHISLAGCFRRCDELREQYQHAVPGTPEYASRVRQWCMHVFYNEKKQICRLRRRCLDRASLEYGKCNSRWCSFMAGSLRPPRMRLGRYLRLRAGRCAESWRTTFENRSLHECFRECDAESRCGSVAYEHEWRRCKLLGRCKKVSMLEVGLCHPRSQVCLFTKEDVGLPEQLVVGSSAPRISRNQSRRDRLSSYTGLKSAGDCPQWSSTAGDRPIRELRKQSLEHCLAQCDALRHQYRDALPGTAEYVLKVRNWCLHVVFDPHMKRCRLRRRCLNRNGLQVGSCNKGYCSYMAGSLKPLRRWLGNYTRLHSAGGCESAVFNIETLQNISLGVCLQVCDSMYEQHRHTRSFTLRANICETVAYSYEARKCVVKRHCSERKHMRAGPCRAANEWCLFTRGPTSDFSAIGTRVAEKRRVNSAAMQLAKREMAGYQSLHEGQLDICRREPPLSSETGELIVGTEGTTWRYFSILECGSAIAPSSSLCLVFKTARKEAGLMGLFSSDGRHFHSLQRVLALPGQWREKQFTHNVAILRLDGDEYAMLGGQQGFVSDRRCRMSRHCRPIHSNGSFVAVSSDQTGTCPVRRTRELSSTWVPQWQQDDLSLRRACEDKGFIKHTGSGTITGTGDTMQVLDLECKSWSPSKSRQHCLRLDTRTHRSLNGTAAPAVGIRLSRGRGLPWDASRWTLPGPPVITGSSPTSCVDRRPSYTGYPDTLACEFDGRLSLVRHGGMFRLYARANLKFHVVSGSRNVQTTVSPDLEAGWDPWKPVHIAGINESEVDIYFFSVQRNPVDSGSLVAIFPITHPPSACIMIAFSLDGLSFQKPVNLRMATLGVRPSVKSSGQVDTARLEWRSEDHPAAGIVQAPNDSSTLLFYVHHAVKGTTIRSGARSHVRSYQMAAKEMLRLTRLALYTHAGEETASTWRQQQPGGLVNRVVPSGNNELGNGRPAVMLSTHSTHSPSPARRGVWERLWRALNLTVG